MASVADSSFLLLLLLFSNPLQIQKNILSSTAVHKQDFADFGVEKEDAFLLQLLSFESWIHMLDM